MRNFKILQIWGKDRYDGRFESLIIDPDPEIPIMDYISPGDEIEDYEIIEIKTKWKNFPSGYQFNRADL